MYFRYYRLWKTSSDLSVKTISNAIIGKTKEIFLIFFPFLESTLNFKHFEKNMMVITNIFPQLQIVKNLVRPLCKKCSFRTRFDSQHVKVSQKLAKSPWENIFHVFPLFWENLIWEMSRRLFPEILGVFLNTLTDHGKYPVEDWENLQFPMQIQLSEKWKTFSQLFIPFLGSTSNFKCFEKKMRWS